MTQKRWIKIAAVTALLLVAGFIGVAAAQEKGTPTVIAIGSGPVGGGFNMIVMGVSKYWEKDLGITGQVVPATPKDSLLRFQAGRLDVFISNTAWYNAAYKGDPKMGFKSPAKDVRLMFHIYSNPYYVITLKNSGIRNIIDLKGKRVGSGAAQDIWEKIIGDKFEANGLKFFGNKPDFKKTWANFNDMARMLGDGTLDACVAMYEGLTPQPATQQLMQEKELRVVEWDPKIFKQFEGSYFPPTVLKKDALPFLEKDHHCFEAGVAAFACGAKVDEQLIYNLTKSMHQNLTQLANENPFWKYPVVYPETLTADYGVPYHTGAIKYWKEVGAWKGN